MLIRRSVSLLSATLLVMMLLAACGGAPAPETQAPTAMNASAATAAPVATTVTEATDLIEATAASIATAAPDATPIKSEGAATGGEGSADTSGSYVADLGFRPDANGFG